MAPKIPKRSTQKKSPINIPKDAKVKIIEITPRTFIIPLLVFALIWALFTLWDQNSSEKITYNDKIGLNEIRQNYESGAYEEIIVSGHEIEGRKQGIKNNVG